MICPNCKKEVGNAKFCPECGTPITQSQDQDSQVMRTTNLNNALPQEKPKKKHGCLVAILVFFFIGMMFVPFMSSNSVNYTAVDNSQTSDEHFEAVALTVSNALAMRGYAPLNYQISWIGYSKYKDTFSIEEFEGLQNGGYYAVSGSTTDGGTYEGDIYAYWDKGTYPELLNLKIFYDDIDQINEVVIDEYSDEEMAKCWAEYQKRAEVDAASSESSSQGGAEESGSHPINEAILSDIQQQAIDSVLYSLDIESEWIENGPAVSGAGFAEVDGLDEIVANMKRFYIHAADGRIYDLFLDTKFNYVVAVMDDAAEGDEGILYEDVLSLVDLYYPPVASFTSPTLVFPAAL